MKQATLSYRLRRIRSGVALAVILCVGTGLVLLLSPVASITPGTCARIHPGMTRQQVEGIIGGPPGWYDGTTSFQFGASSPMGLGSDGLDWFGSGGDIDVVFDGQERVVKVAFYPGQAQQDAPWLLLERLTRHNRPWWLKPWLRGYSSSTP